MLEFCADAYPSVKISQNAQIFKVSLFRKMFRPNWQSSGVQG
jgi:hypothetical protein